MSLCFQFIQKALACQGAEKLRESHQKWRDYRNEINLVAAFPRVNTQCRKRSSLNASVLCCTFRASCAHRIHSASSQREFQHSRIVRVERDAFVAYRCDTL